jgi:hypothetical protein
MRTHRPVKNVRVFSVESGGSSGIKSIETGNLGLFTWGRHARRSIGSLEEPI